MPKYKFLVGAVATLCLLAFADLFRAFSVILVQTEQAEVRDTASSRMALQSSHFTSAHRCSGPSVPVEKLQYLSQQGEDKMLQKWFGGLCNGTYIEMGALDGKRYSNTFVYNQGFDWKGVLIEANPHTFGQLATNRPKEIARVNAAVCQEKKIVHWISPPDPAVGGILEFATEDYVKHWWPDELIAQKQPLECQPLGDLLAQHAPTLTFIDFFSLDVEGAEWEVLSSIDFSSHAFGIIFFEGSSDKFKSLMNRMLLEANGYTFLMRENGSLWFVNNQFASIYKNVVYA